VAVLRSDAERSTEPGWEGRRYVMDSLTDGQLRALRNLADKHTGNITVFLNIADAQHLTQLGFATRSRQGWDITPLGAAYLAGLDREANGSAVTLLRPTEHEGE